MRTRQATVKETQEDLEVSVEEFVSAKKSLEAFDADIAPYGVLALLVRAENKGNASYRVRQIDINASLAGQPLRMLYGEQAANQAATSEYAGKALGWTVVTGPFALLLWPVTVAGSAAHTSSVNRRIQQHFISMEFSDTALKPNQTAAGFVYFKLPGDTRKLEKLLVTVEPFEEQSGRRLSFKFSLPSLELSAGTSPKPEGETR